jgi:hypothetical protein
MQFWVDRRLKDSSQSAGSLAEALSIADLGADTLDGRSTCRSAQSSYAGPLQIAQGPYVLDHA